MKKKIPYVLVGVLIFSGLMVLFYPTVSSYFNAKYQIQAVVQYDDSVKQLTRQAIEEEMERARDYNYFLTGQGITDPFIPGGGSPLPENYVSILNHNDGIMGTIQIPKIDVNLPIYHGTSARTLEKGIGHMEMTAFPIGGKNNHAVLTGHSAMPDAVLFSDLNKLVEGDKFYIKIYEEVVAYRVDQIAVVKPDETKLLLPVEGEDYVSLITCTPYAINSHRLLVRGTRIPYTETEQAERMQHAGNPPKIPIHYDFIVAVSVLVLVILVWMAYLIRRYRKNRSL